MQSKSTFPARIAPFSVLEPLPFSRVGLRKARFVKSGVARSVRNRKLIA